MYIRKDNLVIRNATADDAPTLGKWWRDGDVMAHAGFPLGLTITDEEIARSLAGDTDETRRRLIIEAEDIPIGEMNYRNKGEGVAEIGIKICNQDRQEKGHGTLLLKMLIHSLLYDYHYTKIVLDTNLQNVRAQHVYEKIGFRRVRVNVDAWKDQLGVYQSSVDYELTKEDFPRE